MEGHTYHAGMNHPKCICQQYDLIDIFSDTLDEFIPDYIKEKIRP